MTKPHHAIAHKVLSTLASRAQPGPNITNPDAWRKTVRNDLRHRHWKTLDAILGGDDQERIQALADVLEPPTATQSTETPNPSSALTEWTGPEIEPADGPVIDDPDEARQRIAAIRGELGPAHHPDRNPKQTSHWLRYEKLLGRRTDAEVEWALDRLEQILGGTA